MYHSAQDAPERYADTIGLPNILAMSLFERQLELIVSRYTPVTVEDICLALEGDKPLPSRAVALTFDDGYADNFRIVAPTLDRFGVSAAFYVTVDCIGKSELPWFCRLRRAFRATQKCDWHDPHNRRIYNLSSAPDRDQALRAAMEICVQLTGDRREEFLQSVYVQLDDKEDKAEIPVMMNWDEVRQLHRRGHIVGSHSLTHPNLAHVGDEIIYKELAESKRRLEEELNAPVKHFCYPAAALGNSWNQRTRAILKETGYHYGVTTTPGPVCPGDDPLSLKRVGGGREVGYQFRWHVETTFLGRTL